MADDRIDEGRSELRPERLGGEVRIRLESLGLDAVESKVVSPTEGWQVLAEGTNAGRAVHFDSVAEMQEFVGELQRWIDDVAAGRTDGTAGPVWLLVYLAGHRTLPPEDPAEAGAEAEG